MKNTDQIKLFITIIINLLLFRVTRRQLVFGKFLLRPIMQPVGIAPIRTFRVVKNATVLIIQTVKRKPNHQCSRS